MKYVPKSIVITSRLGYIYIYIDIKENNYKTTQTMKLLKTHNLVFLSPTIVKHSCPASYMLLREVIDNYIQNVKTICHDSQLLANNINENKMFDIST